MDFLKFSQVFQIVVNIRVMQPVSCFFIQKFLQQTCCFHLNWFHNNQVKPNHKWFPNGYLTLIGKFIRFFWFPSYLFVHFLLVLPPPILLLNERRSQDCPSPFPFHLSLLLSPHYSFLFMHRTSTSTYILMTHTFFSPSQSYFLRSSFAGAIACLANLPGSSKGVSISNSHDWYHVLLHLHYSSFGRCFYY